MQMSRELLFHGPARPGRPRYWVATGAYVLGALALLWSFAKKAITVEVVAAVLTLAAVLRLVGSVPDARPGSTPAGTAT